eukprot:CAMPEP_0179164686 /NCGR_PEP_ID=MMETSP0796-20121207/80849_1 /TAXON_ID=73915 /ORGANISM="Pyrodinium bahamense, Strain pbaha01" /LENGTH=326 /DNA_ID=CAMNT_0020867187 /DNA_START=14 /DNA_END=994 /DNA_ORIENTATION=+
MARVQVFAACVVMMSLQPLLIHLAASQEEELRLPAETFMLVVEGLKLLLCGCALAWRRVAGQEAAVWRGIRHTATFAVPAGIYLVMNVLKVLAARALAPPLFQLLAATKILATAVASWMLLARGLTPVQWVAMVMLTLGVGLGQHRVGSGPTSRRPQYDAAPLGSLSLDGAAVPLLPALIMLTNSCLSALAGVYTEKVLKARQSASLSIFAMNLHMAFHTLLLNSVKACIWQAPALASPRAIGWRTWAALLNEAVNGILVSTLMRHADSIVKNYAFSTSIFTTALISVPILHYWPQWPFYAGSVFVLCSMGMYSQGSCAEARKRSA